MERVDRPDHGDDECLKNDVGEAQQHERNDDLPSSIPNVEISDAALTIQQTSETEENDRPLERVEET